MRQFYSTFSVILATWSTFSILLPVQALSNITFYSDTSCQTIIGEKNGPDDGTCTQFLTEASNFGSFRVTSLDQTCAVTIYGANPPFCSSSQLALAPFGDCVTDTSVNQFSVDCQDYSVAISNEPQIFTGEAPGTAAANGNNDSDSSRNGSVDNLSGGAKAGIAIGAAIGGIALTALIVWLAIRNNRRKKRDMEAALVEADSSAAAPPYSELPPGEKKPPVELPPQAMVPVEAPGDDVWPGRELQGDDLRRKPSTNPKDLLNTTETGKSEITAISTAIESSDGSHRSDDDRMRTPALSGISSEDIVSPATSVQISGRRLGF
ncbi:hypothetical protein B0A52_03281 [Exophiala mesophila]|uniref:Mid2 domain-containing protein n=1 Tax=Exophiala mesophila TaxID=212818 RepID=A0A438NAY2_EXOME|nr:hypothetical protein B0A52_03281 [Exophiala mesophila]